MGGFVSAARASAAHSAEKLGRCAMARVKISSYQNGFDAAARTLRAIAYTTSAPKIHTHVLSPIVRMLHCTLAGLRRHYAAPPRIVKPRKSRAPAPRFSAQ